MPMEHVFVQDHEGRKLTDEEVKEIFTPYEKFNPKLIPFDRAKEEGLYLSLIHISEPTRPY